MLQYIRELDIILNFVEKYYYDINFKLINNFHKITVIKLYVYQKFLPLF